MPGRLGPSLDSPGEGAGEGEGGAHPDASCQLRPEIVRKRQTRLEGFNEKIIASYDAG
jgi:hypothetical protein